MFTVQQEVRKNMTRVEMMVLGFFIHRQTLPNSKNADVVAIASFGNRLDKVKAKNSGNGENLSGLIDCSLSLHEC
jgi:hypothetical protein